MKKLTLDTETCGLAGVPIIVQYAIEDGPIHIHNFWTNDVNDSMQLIEMFCEHAIIGFNLSFDWFMLAKMYTMLNILSSKGLAFARPEDHINLMGNIEADARFGPCVKPASACDLMLVARKTKYQITMNRGDIKIRRVPTALAWELAAELEERIIFKGILFARRKDKYAPRWQVFDSTNRTTGKNDPEFKDVVLKFKPSVALKALAIDALGVEQDDVLLFSDIDVEKGYLPIENKFAPFATSVAKEEDRWYGYIKKGRKRVRGFAWPGVIRHHIEHWTYNAQARKYAAKDVDYTRRLYHHFGDPEVGDDDSVLACSVGAVRWRGYSFNLDGVKRLRDEAVAKTGKYPTSSKKSKAYLYEVLSDVEILALQTTGTSKVQLEELAKMRDLPCPFCEDHPRNRDGCVACDGRGRYDHPVADRAKNIIDTRIAYKEIELYDKILLAGRFHTSFKVIGTLSSRMSGADGLNPQGINHNKKVRSQFTFGDDELPLYGGDFDAFEVGLADAAYNDPVLRQDLQSGKKIHALFALSLFPDKSYDEIVRSKGSSFDMYDYGKRGVFSQIYGGDAGTLQRKLGISIDDAISASKRFAMRYPTMFKNIQRVIDAFCSMKQPEGIGKRIYWHEPAEYAESLFGFRRYFTLENEICRALFALANKLPEKFKSLKIKVKRRKDGSEQFAGGATMSALFGAAFGIQGQNTRAARNHEIQSSGATITKYVQRKIWDIQPAGVHRWLVQPCNIHDEILSPTHPSVADKVKETVDASVAFFRKRVPLIEMDWKPMKNWAEK